MKTDQLIDYFLDMRADTPPDVQLERIKKHITNTGVTDEDIIERVRHVEELLTRTTLKMTDRMSIEWALSEIDALILIIPSLSGKSSGGETTAKERRKKKEERVKEAVRIWDSLSTKPEHNRANIIAKRMGKSPTAIRGYLREAGIKTNRR